MWALLPGSGRNGEQALSAFAIIITPRIFTQPRSRICRRQSVKRCIACPVAGQPAPTNRTTSKAQATVLWALSREAAALANAGIHLSKTIEIANLAKGNTAASWQSQSTQSQRMKRLPPKYSGERAVRPEIRHKPASKGLFATAGQLPTKHATCRKQVKMLADSVESHNCLCEGFGWLDRSVRKANCGLGQSPPRLAGTALAMGLKVPARTSTRRANGHAITHAFCLHEHVCAEGLLGGTISFCAASA